MENGREQSTTDSGLLYFTTVLDSLWKGLKKFFWLVLPLVIAGAGLMYGVTRLAYTPSYKAYTSFVVSAQGSDNSLANYYNITTAEQLQESFEAILESGTLKELVMDDLGLSEIPGTISVEIPEDTSVAIFTINVISSDAQTAYD
ncbi:MAG: Wzz/FepE/Etk N-terminal domain-containing protein, partial [Clostridiales bacterium]|nr:Wzz/FepE/Etk N-terminal domain-containing protein [Clostridiales bacterium]